MNQVIIAQATTKTRSTLKAIKFTLPALFSGLLIPFGFAPFHKPGLALLGLALFFVLLSKGSIKQVILNGVTFGIGFFGLSVSWVYVSIHDYGHLNTIISAAITLLFILYLSIYPALIAVTYRYLAQGRSLFFSALLFSVLWSLSEYLRATIFGGFPWALLGFGQVDTPIKNILPYFGLYGAGFTACLAASFLGASMLAKNMKRWFFIIAFALTLLLPGLLKNTHFNQPIGSPLSVSVVQANLSMRDKWDENLFWQLLKHYSDAAEKLVKSTQLVVMPESAIPIPTTYISDAFDALHDKAREAESSILLGTLQPTESGDALYNAMIALGRAKGAYQKQHLVPFGEFIPKPFKSLFEWLSLPFDSLTPGSNNQPLIRIQNHPIATLICYELAYPALLRQQLPLAEWIVSISDDGWFGHSFAIFQQLQIAQAVSKQTARYQIVANNDGLSSIIDPQGQIIRSLAPYTSGVLESQIVPTQGVTPWVYWGDTPILIFFIACIIFAALLKYTKSF